MDFLSAWAADIWPKHDEVWRLSVHILWIEVTVEELDVSTATVNVLLMLYRELKDKCFLFVGELRELGGNCIKVGILGGLDGCWIKESKLKLEIQRILLENDFPKLGRVQIKSLTVVLSIWVEFAWSEFKLSECLVSVFWGDPSFCPRVCKKTKSH